MKCPKCGYASFPYLHNCTKCGQVLAEVRQVLGPYALPPLPLDLMMAYDTAPMQDAETVNPDTAASSMIDRGRGDDVELDHPGSAEAVGPRAEDERPDAPAHMTPMFDLDLTVESALPPSTADNIQSSSTPSVDLSGFDELTFEIEDGTGDDRLEPPEPSNDSAACMADEPMFDLDVEDELELDIDEGEAEDEGRQDERDTGE